MILLSDIFKILLNRGARTEIYLIYDNKDVRK